MENVVSQLIQIFGNSKNHKILAWMHFKQNWLDFIKIINTVDAMFQMTWVHSNIVIAISFVTVGIWYVIVSCDVVQSHFDVCRWVCFDYIKNEPIPFGDAAQFAINYWNISRWFKEANVLHTCIHVFDRFIDVAPASYDMHCGCAHGYALIAISVGYAFLFHHQFS